MIDYDILLEKRKEELRTYHVYDLRKKYKSVAAGYSVLNKESLVYALADYEIWHNHNFKDDQIDVTEGLKKLSKIRRRTTAC